MTSGWSSGSKGGLDELPFGVSSGMWMENDADEPEEDDCSSGEDVRGGSESYEEENSDPNEECSCSR